jgi:hypothetical protein
MSVRANCDGERVAREVKTTQDATAFLECCKEEKKRKDKDDGFEDCESKRWKREGAKEVVLVGEGQ